MTGEGVGGRAGLPPCRLFPLGTRLGCRLGRSASLAVALEEADLVRRRVDQHHLATDAMRLESFIADMSASPRADNFVFALRAAVWGSRILGWKLRRSRIGWKVRIR